MKTVVITNLGFEVERKNVPETIAEAVTAAGSEETVLQGFIDYTIAHRDNAKVRKAIVERVEARTGIKRAGVQEGDKWVITEKAEPFVERVRATVEESVMTELAREIRHAFPEVDWTPGARGSGKLGQEWLAAYDELVEKEKLVGFCAKHGIDSSLEEEVLRPMVALKVKQLVEAAKQAAKDAAMGV
jgi:hypothetical protein